MIYYIIGLLFIWTEIYYVTNKPLLDLYFKNKDIKSPSKTNYFYYLTRLFYYIWLSIGLFTGVNTIICLVLLRCLSLPFYYINRKLYIIWSNILPSISILFILLAIFYSIKG